MLLLTSVFAYLYLGTASAQSINDCEGLQREQCMWKLTCAKDPNQPNKIIPADCAANYKDPAPPAPPQPPEPPKAKAPEKTPIEQLYYVDVDSLRDQFMLPEDATNEDIFNAVSEEKIENEKALRREKAKAEETLKHKKPVKIDLPTEWKVGDEYY